MTKEEKQKKLFRLQSRVLRITSLYAQSIEYKETIGESKNKFDAIGDIVLPRLKFVLHVANLAKRIRVIQSTKTID